MPDGDSALEPEQEQSRSNGVMYRWVPEGGGESENRRGAQLGGVSSRYHYLRS